MRGYLVTLTTKAVSDKMVYYHESGRLLDGEVLSLMYHDEGYFGVSITNISAVVIAGVPLSRSFPSESAVQNAIRQLHFGEHDGSHPLKLVWHNIRDESFCVRYEVPPDMPMVEPHTYYVFAPFKIYLVSPFQDQLHVEWLVEEEDNE